MQLANGIRNLGEHRNHLRGREFLGTECVSQSAAGNRLGRQIRSAILVPTCKRLREHRALERTEDLELVTHEFRAAPILRLAQRSPAVIRERCLIKIDRAFAAREAVNTQRAVRRFERSPGGERLRQCRQFD